jgi:hypothetical protein
MPRVQGRGCPPGAATSTTGQQQRHAPNAKQDDDLAERSSSGTGGAAVSMNEATDIQITVGVDTTTSAPPVVQQRHCSPLVGSWSVMVVLSRG